MTNPTFEALARQIFDSRGAQANCQGAPTWAQASEAERAWWIELAQRAALVDQRQLEFAMNLEDALRLRIAELENERRWVAGVLGEVMRALDRRRPSTVKADQDSLRFRGRNGGQVAKRPETAN